MPWRCPACSSQIRRTEADDRPRPGQIYRCYVCRLELVLDPATDRLVIAPFDGDPAADKERLPSE